jgi:hypothetical protein
LVDLVWTEDIRIIADPLDCSPTLVNVGFVYSIDVLGSATPGTHVIYTTGAADESITTSYTDVFTEIKNTDCPVSKCTLEVAGCTGTVFTSSNVFIGASSPFQVTATR